MNILGFIIISLILACLAGGGSSAATGDRDVERLGADVGGLSTEALVSGAPDWLLAAGETFFSRPGTDRAAAAYDSARGCVVWFGGFPSAETWEWDGTTWIQRAPTTSPPARRSHAMAYDSARGRVVLFGGRRFGSTYLDDTWAYCAFTGSPAIHAASR